MVEVNNFENMSQLRELMDRPMQTFAQPFTELKLSEMQNLTSNPNTSKDHLPALQINPDKGDVPQARPQTLESRTPRFAPSMGQHIPFVSELTPEFLKSVKEQFKELFGIGENQSRNGGIETKGFAARETGGDAGRESGSTRLVKPGSEESGIKTTIKPNGNNGFKEINTLGGTNEVVSTVDVYLDPKDRSITRATRMADGKLFSLETEHKDKSREIITFDEQERKMSTQVLLPNGGYEMRDANDKVIFSNMQTAAGERVQKPHK